MPSKNSYEYRGIAVLPCRFSGLNGANRWQFTDPWSGLLNRCKTKEEVRRLVDALYIHREALELMQCKEL